MFVLMGKNNKQVLKRALNSDLRVEEKPTHTKPKPQTKPKNPIFKPNLKASVF